MYQKASVEATRQSAESYCLIAQTLGIIPAAVPSIKGGVAVEVEVNAQVSSARDSCYVRGELLLPLVHMRGALARHNGDMAKHMPRRVYYDPAASICRLTR